MAVLSDALRRAIWQEFMQVNADAVGITKADLRAAVDAIDTWVDSNAASMNTAIPQPARSGLSAAQKARLLAFVALKRYGG
jgi:Ni2+-binding GTPase involved in maturation of urease and hydrogenase